MPQSLFSLGSHIIFSTKGRLPVLSADSKAQVHAYMAGTLRELECAAINVGGTADHVHILCNLSKSMAPVKAVETLKRESSKFAKTLRPELADFRWQAGYGLFGVGPKQCARVRAYVQGQEEHHRRESFQEEFRRLLIEFEIPFDERYVWD
jgi:putative transposase